MPLLHDHDPHRDSQRPVDARSSGVVRSTSAVALSASVLGTIVLITAIAPLATDMYVPAFPLVGRDLDASATQVQLTLTTFFVGHGAGSAGRRPVLGPGGTPAAAAGCAGGRWWSRRWRARSARPRR